jgi:hypothetical protein
VVLKGLEDMVHEVLHTGQGIGWTKAHDLWGIEPPGCLKCYKVLHFIAVSNVPVAITEIKFTKEYHSSYSFDNSVNTREGEDVFDYDSIDFPIIKYRVVTSILFLDVENRC